MTYQVLQGKDGKGLVKAWVKDVLFEDEAQRQLKNIASLPFIHQWVAVMPDVHAGIGATVGSVIPTIGAIIPAAVGVDIGCGMMACKTTLKGKDLSERQVQKIYDSIRKAVPHGRTDDGGRNDRGSWGNPPPYVQSAWLGIEAGYDLMLAKHRGINHHLRVDQLGTLGTGNHFIEVCLDEEDTVWFMLHSGSRGIGNLVGRYFIDLARKDMQKWFINLPDKDLAYFPEGTEHFEDYVEAVSWAQNYAKVNRELMMHAAISATLNAGGLPNFYSDVMVVNCHHNYVEIENHYEKNVYVTRKGAVRARTTDLGIIPGSMGTASYIVRGKGNAESFNSCSHGAGRRMSRTEAKKRFTIEDHEKATRGVVCRQDKDVIDETPKAYKDINKVMAAQSDLVEIIHELKQIICIKG